MAINEYRRYAAECVLIADGMTSPGHKVSLLAMAQAWLKLARRAEDDAAPTEASAPVSVRQGDQVALFAGGPQVSAPAVNQAKCPIRSIPQAPDYRCGYD